MPLSSESGVNPYDECKEVRAVFLPAYPNWSDFLLDAH
jgi:hypothetical protein